MVNNHKLKDQEILELLDGYSSEVVMSDSDGAEGKYNTNYNNFLISLLLYYT